MCPGSPASLLCMNFWKIQQGTWTLASLLSSDEAFLLKTQAQLGGTITAKADAAATARIFHGFSVKPGRARDRTSGGTCVRVFLLSIGPHSEGQLPLGGSFSHLLPSITAVQLWSLG